MKLQFIASVAAVLLNSGHGVFAAKDEPKGLRGRGSIEFLKYQKSKKGRCYDACCDYAGEDQVLLGYRNIDCNTCEGVFNSYGGKSEFCRDYDGNDDEPSPPGPDNDDEHRHRPNRGFHSSGGNCCGVPVGGTCPAGYESDTMIGSMNGMELCCRDLQNVVITGSPPKCKGSTRAPPKPNAQGTIPCTQYGGVMKSCPQGFDMNDGDDACTCTPSTPAPPKPKAQGPVPCTRSNSGYNMDCPDGMDMSIDGASSCTCTPRVPQGTIPCTQYGGFMKSCPQGFDMNDGNDACTCTPSTSSECDVVTNAMNRAMGCMNVGDDQSTCEACGCSYVAPARMCVEGGYAAY